MTIHAVTFIGEGEEILVGPFVEGAWEYREKDSNENTIDFLMLDYGW